MRAFLTVVLSMGAALTIFVAVAAGAGLESRIGDVKNGTVVFRYETWPDVWGDDRGSLNRGGLDGGLTVTKDGDWRKNRGWHQGPMLVEARFRRGDLHAIHARVDNGRPLDDDVVDLGSVAPQEAADWLLRMAGTARGPVAEDCIAPALFAKDAVVTPKLFELARDRSRPGDVRSSVLFWLGQEAAERVGEQLGEIAEDDEDAEVRESAVFALSRRPADESIPLLAELARTSPHADVRRSAYFWLAQSDDPRVLDLFEEVLGRN
jgi:hypothetical protein